MNGDIITREKFEKLTEREMVTIVNRCKGNSKEFKTICNCDFSYNTASEIMLSQGCVLVGNVMWQPPMFTRDEKRVIFATLKEIADEKIDEKKADRKKTTLTLKKIDTVRHTTVRLDESTWQRWLDIVDRTPCVRPAMLLDALFNHAMDEYESGNLSINVIY